jgi:7-cyano-7-deazaguanine synthase
VSVTYKALVLLSGGQDSTTCLAAALEEFPGHVMAIGFDYGQRHKIELEQAVIIAKKANVPFEVLDLTFLSQLTANALTRTDIAIEAKDGELPSTFVEGRNLFFLSAAAVYSKQKNIPYIYTGVCETDYSGYPDCRHAFVQSLNQTVNLAMATNLTFMTPLMWLTKAETVLYMEKLGKLAWYADTHTCYEGKRPACGTCPACILRLKGFEEAGIKDPLDYE